MLGQAVAVKDLHSRGMYMQAHGVMYANSVAGTSERADTDVDQIVG